MIRSRTFDLSKGQGIDSIAAFFRDNSIERSQVLFSRAIQIAPGDVRAVVIYNDVIPPAVVGTSPADGAVNIPTGATILVSMSENIATVTGKVEVRRNGVLLTDVVDYTIAPVGGSWPASAFTISGAVSAVTNANYAVTLDSSIVDTGGNEMIYNVVFTFNSAR